MGLPDVWPAPDGRDARPARRAAHVVGLLSRDDGTVARRVRGGDLRGRAHHRRRPACGTMSCRRARMPQVGVCLGLSEDEPPPWTAAVAWCPCRGGQVGHTVARLRAEVEIHDAFAGDHLSGATEDDVSSATWGGPASVGRQHTTHAPAVSC